MKGDIRNQGNTPSCLAGPKWSATTKDGAIHLENTHLIEWATEAPDREICMKPMWKDKKKEPEFDDTWKRFVYFCFLTHEHIVSLWSSISVNTITAGQLLCGGLFSVDSLSTWFASVAMLHAIMENPTQKEQLLRVQLATSLGSPPVSLLQQCCNILAQVSS